MRLVYDTRTGDVAWRCVHDVLLSQPCATCTWLIHEIGKLKEAQTG